MPGDCYAVWNMRSWKMSLMEILFLSLSDRSMKSIKINGLSNDGFVMTSKGKEDEKKINIHSTHFLTELNCQSWIVNVSPVQLRPVQSSSFSSDVRSDKIIIWMKFIIFVQEKCSESGAERRWRYRNLWILILTFCDFSLRKSSCLEGKSRFLAH